jgi:signal transduction histidine kinase
MRGLSRPLVVAAAALTAVFALTAWRLGDLDAQGLPLLALNTLPLLLLRRNPLVVLLVLAIAYPAWIGLGHEPHLLQSLPAVAAMFAVGAWDRPLWLRALGLLAPMWMIVAALLWQAPESEIGYAATVFVVVWALGVALTDRRSRAEELEARTVALERARHELADRAVADERVRIARELHDVVAHAMSVITVRAGVGAHLLDSRPAEAAEALRVIESTGPDPHGPARRRRSLTLDRRRDGRRCRHLAGGGRGGLRGPRRPPAGPGVLTGRLRPRPLDAGGSHRARPGTDRRRTSPCRRATDHMRKALRTMS